MSIPFFCDAGMALRWFVARGGRRAASVTAVATLLVGCAGGPKAPGWQVHAHAAQQRAIEATLEGNTRVETVEWQRAIAEVSRTARPALVARVALSQCAVRQATLQLESCPDWAALESEAEPSDQAYARYLAGQPLASDVPLLPTQHQPLARLLLEPQVAAAGPVLSRMEAPLARLVAASVVFRSGHADAEVVAQAVATASAQGWRRPLWAWLKVQQQAAQAAGDSATAAAAERRLAVLSAGKTVRE